MANIKPNHVAHPHDIDSPHQDDPTVRAARRVGHRSDDGTAFFPDPLATGGSAHRLAVDDAESFAEEFIAAATTGDDVHENSRDEIAEEEDGGPFLVLSDESEDLPDLTPEPTAARPAPRRRPRA